MTCKVQCKTTHTLPRTICMSPDITAPRLTPQGSGSSAFRPTAAARQQQQQHAQQVLQFLTSHAAGELNEAQVPAVHRYDGGVTDCAGEWIPVCML
jgi:hypothetical protein